MALAPCKECKKEVSTGAKTCPNCGVKDPTITRTDKFLGLILLIGIVGVVVYACSPSSPPKESASPAAVTAPASTAPAAQPATEETRPNFGFDSNEFRTRFNSLAKDFGNGWPIQRPFTISNGSKKNTWNHTIAETPMIGTVDKQSGRLESVMVTVTGGDNTKTMNTMSLLLIVGNSLTGGDRREQVSATLVRLMKKAMDSKDADTASDSVGNVTISATLIQGMGMLVAFTPAQ
jgi:hypothetical protein